MIPHMTYNDINIKFPFFVCIYCQIWPILLNRKIDSGNTKLDGQVFHFIGLW